MAQHEVTITLIAHDNNPDAALTSHQREQIDAMASEEARSLQENLEEINPGAGNEVVVTRQRRVTLTHAASGVTDD